MQSIIWNQGEEKPEPVMVARVLGQPVATINVLVERDPENHDTWRWLDITLPPAKWNYALLVDRLVTLYYPSDRMQATINNYLLNMSDQEASEEFMEMQEWRATAKGIARQLLQYARDNHLIEEYE